MSCQPATSGYYYYVLLLPVLYVPYVPYVCTVGKIIENTAEERASVFRELKFLWKESQPARGKIIRAQEFHSFLLFLLFAFNFLPPTTS